MSRQELEAKLAELRAKLDSLSVVSPEYRELDREYMKTLQALIKAFEGAKSDG